MNRMISVYEAMSNILVGVPTNSDELIAQQKYTENARVSLSKKLENEVEETKKCVTFLYSFLDLRKED